MRGTYRLTAFVSAIIRFSTATTRHVVLAVCVATHSAVAADFQQLTDKAAVAAKKELCIALNKQSASSELETKFFEFYEGKRASASYLDPDTFRVGQVGPLPRFTVRQVLGPEKMLGSIDFAWFLLNKVSTRDVADDQVILLKEWFVIRETQTYSTVAGGTKTVYVLEPVENNKFNVRPTRVYPWYNRDDEVVVEGEFNRIQGSKALFLVDGHESTFALSKFTPGDRALMRLIAARYPSAKPADAPAPKPAEKPAVRRTID